MKLIYPWVIAVGVVVLIGLAVFGRKKKSTYKEGKKVANTDFIEETQLYQKLKRQYHIFSTMALLCLFIAIVCGFVLLSRPARVEQVNTELRNRDIFLCMDVSVSMDELNVEIQDRDLDHIHQFLTSLKNISEEEMSDHEAFLHKLEGVDSFFILYTGKSYPVALDIESKFSEGAIGNTQLADYRNFAHGRFNWFTQRPGQTGLICLQTPDDLELSETILRKLPMHVPTLRLRTDHSTPLGCIDLLIKEHYLSSALADRWGLDISRPTVPEYGRFLYKM